MMRIDLPLCSIKFCKYFFDGNCGATEGQRGRCEFLEALRAQQSGGWISVEGRLPEEGTRILVANDEIISVVYNLFDELDEYTHWQPLPAPPEPKEG